MRQVTGRGQCGQPDGAATPSRRVFLGIGASCVLPLAAGLPFRGAGVLTASQGPIVSDPVWDHLAGEARQLLAEVEQQRGPRGEHVRRLASQVGLFAAHLQGSGFDTGFDAEVRRLVKERGKDQAAWEIIDQFRNARAHIPRLGGPRGRQPELAHEAVVASLVELDARGAVNALQSWRPRLGRLAARLDREAATASPTLRGASLTAQKPGDDFQGLPDLELSHEEACRLLNAWITTCNLAIAVLAVTGCEPAAAALGVISGILSVMEHISCYQLLD